MAEWHGPDLTGVALHSGRVTLRPWQRGDAARVQQIMADRRMHGFLPLLPDPYTAADARAFVTEIGPASAAAGTGIAFAVADNSTGEVVGAAGLRLPTDRAAAEIGYWTAAAAWGRGYATEAARTLTRFGFSHGLHRITIRCDVRNAASAAAALKAGFRFEGVARDGGQTPAGATDHALFARLRGDPDEPVPPSWPATGALSDGRVTLRPMAAEDWPVAAAEERDPECRRWSLFAHPRSEEQIRAAAARADLDRLVGNQYRLVIADHATGAAAGTMTLRRVGPPGVVGIGYAVLAAFRGRGFTARALDLVSGWAFTATPTVRLELGCRTDNIASATVARRGGFVSEGVFRGRLAGVDGAHHDEIGFARLRPRPG